MAYSALPRTQTREHVVVTLFTTRDIFLRETAAKNTESCTYTIGECTKAWRQVHNHVCFPYAPSLFIPVTSTLWPVSLCCMALSLVALFYFMTPWIVLCKLKAATRGTRTSGTRATCFKTL